MSLKKVHQHIDDHFDEHLEATRVFVRQPSISADGTGIKEMAELCAEKVRELGGRAEIVPTAGHPVVYGDLQGGAGAAKTLLVYGMYDVQPVLGEEWMVKDPFGGEIVELPEHGPSLVNRGVFNSKGPLVGFFNVLESIKEVEGELPLHFKFMMEGEEELGSKHLPDFVAEHKDRLQADAAFFPFYSQDPTGKAINYLGVKGIVFFELIARGGEWGGPTTRMVHSSNAVWFHSPTWLLVHALSTMLTLDQKHILIDGFYDDVVPPGAEDEELLAGLIETFDSQIQLQQNDVLRFKYDLEGVDLLRKYLYQPSISIDGIISGHTAEGTKTVLPHEARAKMDIRLVPNMRPEKVIEQVKEHLKRHGFGQIEVLVHDSYSWAKVSVKEPPVRALLDTYSDFGCQVEVWPHLAGSAPLYLFTDELKVPVAMGGLGHGGRAHSPNEYATVEGMRLFEKSIATFLDKLAAV